MRDVLVYSLAGELLSHEQITLLPPAGFAMPRYTVTAYTLYLEVRADPRLRSLIRAVG